MMAGGAKYHSARRLLRAVSVLQEEVSRMNESATFLEAVAATAGMDPGNPAVLTLCQSILELPHQVKSDLHGFEGDQAKYAMRGIDALIRTLHPRSLLTPWAEVYTAIDSVGMPGLTICSMLLDARSGEKGVDEDELNKIAEDARALLEEVRLNESLPAEVLEFVESALVSLLNAIDEYWLKGSIAIERVVDNTIGRAVREHRFEKPGSRSRQVLRRLGIILTRVAVVVAVANDLDSLPATVHDVVHEIVEIVDPGQLDAPVPREQSGSVPSPEGPPVESR